VKFIKRASLILLGRLLLFAVISAFFWIPLIRYYIIRYSLFGGDWWHQLDWSRLDWLLIGVFFFMTTVCVFTVDIRRNWLLLAVAMVGGLCIEGWGTQTELWHYYTKERPPLWILPAWPTAALTVDAVSRLLSPQLIRIPARFYTVAAWVLFSLFYLLMILFAYPYLHYSMTVFSFAVILLVSVSIVMGTCDRRIAVIIFVIGSALGYFLELWGTSRHCWIYYTRETPPVFAVLSHGIASVTFWRAHLILDQLIRLVFPGWRGHWSSEVSRGGPTG